MAINFKVTLSILRWLQQFKRIFLKLIWDNICNRFCYNFFYQFFNISCKFCHGFTFGVKCHFVERFFCEISKFNKCLKCHFWSLIAFLSHTNLDTNVSSFLVYELIWNGTDQLELICLILWYFYHNIPLNAIIITYCLVHV